MPYGYWSTANSSLGATVTPHPLIRMRGDSFPERINPMTETFTFKPSPLMPLRLRLVNAEIKRKLKWLDRYSATDEASLSETDLRLTTQSLYHKVAMLWKNFGVTPNLLLTDGFFWEVDELPIIYLLSFKLNQEFKHYDRMLRREEAAGVRKINRVHRLLPSWIKSDERYERAKQRWN